MDLTVAVICSSDPLLSECLASIPRQVPVIVVLNNPTEYVLEVVREAGDRIAVLRQDEPNLGRLRQLAADATETESIMYLDSDCVLTSGAVEEVRRALENWPAVSVPMRYRSTNWTTKVTSKCREFTTPDHALLIPAAFRLDIQELIGGYLYNADLPWGEDVDPGRRIVSAGLEFGVSRGLVLHRALGFQADSASARRLGRGRRIREQAGIENPRSLRHDLSVAHELRLAGSCFEGFGVAAALYHLFVWRPSYKLGYWIERWRNK